MTSARAAPLFFIFFAGCADQSFVEVPQGIRWLAVVQNDEATPLVPYIEQPLAAYIDPRTDTQIIGYRPEDLSVDESIINSSEPLQPSSSCPHTCRVPTARIAI
ncbi:MAG: hypothetical protein AAF449_24065, partial [Myxococcota bacterium]